MSDTKINWATKVWNPVTGCTHAGVGCQHCYAERMWPRLASMSEKYKGRKFGDVMVHPDVLTEPLKWRKTQAVFVDSMGDLFHKAVNFNFTNMVFEAMECVGHTFIILTKRPDIAKEFIGLWLECGKSILSNVVLGVSCSTQAEVDRWVPILLDTPAHRRIVSLEPLVERVTMYGLCNLKACGDYSTKKCDNKACPSRLDGVILGGESGPGARPMHPDWVRGVRDECEAAGVSFFFKQWGEWAPCPDADWHGLGSTGRPKQLAMWPCGKTCGGFLGQDAANKAEAEGCKPITNVGTHRAGRTLDGRTHDELCWEAVK